MSTRGIGRPLDDQLRLEALNAYSCADPQSVALADVTNALVQVELNRPADQALAGEEE